MTSQGKANEASVKGKGGTLPTPSSYVQMVSHNGSFDSSEHTIMRADRTQQDSMSVDVGSVSSTYKEATAHGEEASYPKLGRSDHDFCALGSWARTEQKQTTPEKPQVDVTTAPEENGNGA